MESGGAPEQQKLKRMSPQTADDKGKGKACYYASQQQQPVRTQLGPPCISVQRHLPRVFTLGKDNVTETKEAEDEVEDVEEEVEVVMGDVPLFSLPEDYKFKPYFTVEEGEKMRYIPLLVLSSINSMPRCVVLCGQACGTNLICTVGQPFARFVFGRANAALRDLPPVSIPESFHEASMSIRTLLHS